MKYAHICVCIIVYVVVYVVGQDDNIYNGIVFRLDDGDNDGYDNESMNWKSIVLIKSIPLSTLNGIIDSQNSMSKYIE